MPAGCIRVTWKKLSGIFLRTVISDLTLAMRLPGTAWSLMPARSLTRSCAKRLRRRREGDDVRVDFLALYFRICGVGRLSGDLRRAAFTAHAFNVGNQRDLR